MPFVEWAMHGAALGEGRDTLAAAKKNQSTESGTDGQSTPEGMAQVEAAVGHAGDSSTVKLPTMTASVFSSQSDALREVADQLARAIRQPISDPGSPAGNPGHLEVALCTSSTVGQLQQLSLQQPSTTTPDAAPLSAAISSSISGEVRADASGGSSSNGTAGAAAITAPVVAAGSLPMHVSQLQGLQAVALPQGGSAVVALVPVQRNATGGIVALDSSAILLAALAPKAPVNSPETVKVVISAGGTFEHSAGNSLYSGGETRLTTFHRTSTMESLLQQLSRGSSFDITQEYCIKYQLPGCPGVLVDLINDQDVVSMWEEITEFFSTDRTGFKLQVYLQYPATPTAAVSKPAPAPSPSAVTDSAKDVEEIVRAAAAEPAARPLARFCSDDSAHTDEISKSKDFVTDNPRMSLQDLEEQIALLSPHELAIRRFLGSGSFGEVYLASWYSTDVAVKCLNLSLFTADGGLGRVSHSVVEELLKEASIMSTLRHPNVVWVYGLVLPQPENIDHLKANLSPGESIDAVPLAADAANATGALPGIIRPPALVTEYLAGGSLHSAIRRKAEFLQRDMVKVKLALDAAKGMEYLHSRQIVHFDLKSGNLLITFRDKTPCCKVSDFGLSKRKQQTYLSGVTSMRGTLPWTAPEIIRTPHAVTEKVDVYSFAMVLWELWTFREPFDGIDFYALLHQLSQDATIRPPLPGSSDWEGPPLSEPAPGYTELMTSCWQDDFKLRPSFSFIVDRLEEMMAALRLARKRTGSL